MQEYAMNMHILSRSTWQDRSNRCLALCLCLQASFTFLWCLRGATLLFGFPAHCTLVNRGAVAFVHSKCSHPGTYLCLPFSFLTACMCKYKWIKFKIARLTCFCVLSTCTSLHLEWHKPSEDGLPPLSHEWKANLALSFQCGCESTANIEFLCLSIL